MPVDSHLKSSSANRSSSKCVEMENPVSASNTEVLSIEETNRLRAKLGLKPLQVEDEIAGNFSFTSNCNCIVFTV